MASTDRSPVGRYGQATYELGVFSCLGLLLRTKCALSAANRVYLCLYPCENPRPAGLVTRLLELARDEDLGIGGLPGDLTCKVTLGKSFFIALHFAQ